MSAPFLLFSVMFLSFSVILLLVIVVRRRIFNVHKIWGLALKGDRLAVMYSVAIVVAFGLALVAALIELFGV